MASTFQCPQCIAVSQTSQVVAQFPIQTPNGNTIFFNAQGQVNTTSGLNVLVYNCTNNHTGIVTRPTGF